LTDLHFKEGKPIRQGSTMTTVDLCFGTTDGLDEMHTVLTDQTITAENTVLLTGDVTYDAQMFVELKKEEGIVVYRLESYLDLISCDRRKTSWEFLSHLASLKHP